MQAFVVDLATEEPLSLEGYAIKSADPAAFEAVEAIVKKHGKPCYIEWYRDEDGFRGYWGPKGACLTRFVYNA